MIVIRLFLGSTQASEAKHIAMHLYESSSVNINYFVRIQAQEGSNGGYFLIACRAGEPQRKSVSLPSLGSSGISPHKILPMGSSISCFSSNEVGVGPGRKASGAAGSAFEATAGDLSLSKSSGQGNSVSSSAAATAISHQMDINTPIVTQQGTADKIERQAQQPTAQRAVQGSAPGGQAPPSTPYYAAAAMPAVPAPIDPTSNAYYSGSPVGVGIGTAQQQLHRQGQFPQDGLVDHELLSLTAGAGEISAAAFADSYESATAVVKQKELEAKMRAEAGRNIATVQSRIFSGREAKDIAKMTDWNQLAAVMTSKPRVTTTS